MRKLRSTLTLCAAVCLAALSSHAAEPLEPGKDVPAVKGVDTDNESFDVTAYVKQGTTLVFFFPKANTGG